MIRFAWQQFRLQAAIAGAILAVVAVIVVAIHPQLVHLFRLHETAALMNKYGSYEDVATLLLVAPALVGAFWGAPLLARELEAFTFRLVWTQSVTRRRWLAVKLALVGGASVAVCGLLSLAVTWWASPVDRVNLNRFSSTVVFSERDLVPLGYAAFAFALGLVLGVLVRRTVPAMAATLAVFVGVRFAFTRWVRPHLLAPVHSLVRLTSANIVGLTMPAPASRDPVLAQVSTQHPGAWVLSSGGRFGEQAIVNSAGKVVYGLSKTLSKTLPHGQGPSATLPGTLRSALLRLHLYVPLVYQPASRFWTFQVLETAIFGGVALILVGFCFWWLRRLT